MLRLDRPQVRTAVALAAIVPVVAVPNAEAPFAGFAPGDASHLGRLLALHLASAVGLLVFHQHIGRAALDWLAAGLPAWVHLEGFPAPLAVFAFVVPATVLVATGSLHRRIVVVAHAIALTILGAAGWIFHYFATPVVPAAIALGITWTLGIPAAVAAAGVVRRWPAAVPVAALLWPLTEWIRGSVMSPPLPGLTVPTAVADTALTQAIQLLGEFGMSYVVSGFALGCAVAWTRVSGRARTGVAVGALAASALVGSLPASSPASDAATRVCAVPDPDRLKRSVPAFDGGRGAAVSAIARRAEARGCAITVFPEYSLELHERDLLSREEGIHRSARSDDGVLVGGVYSMTRNERGQPVDTRNVVCQLHRDGGPNFRCSDPLDKLVFAPFGEVALFHDSPLLAGLGARLSKVATGETYHGVDARRTGGVVDAGGFLLGGAICWEILVPDIFGRRDLTAGDIALLVVPSDLDGFGSSRAAIEQFRRAARLHARRMRAPLVFASTHDPFLVDASGERVEPVHRERFLAVWDVELAPAPSGGERL